MDRPFGSTVFCLWSGLLIWAADFLSIYVFAALACARGFAHVEVLGLPIVPFATVLATSAALAANAFVLARAWRQARHSHSGASAQFIPVLTAALAALGILATAWSALPSLLLRTGCG
jgi:hypothetical protein